MSIVTFLIILLIILSMLGIIKFIPYLLVLLLGGLIILKVPLKNNNLRKWIFIPFVSLLITLMILRMGTIKSQTELASYVNKEIQGTVLYSQSTDNLLKIKHFGSDEDLAKGISKAIKKLQRKTLKDYSTLMIVSDNWSVFIYPSKIEHYPTEYNNAENYLSHLLDLQNQLK